MRRSVRDARGGGMADNAPHRRRASDRARERANRAMALGDRAAYLMAIGQLDEADRRRALWRPARPTWPRLHRALHGHAGKVPAAKWLLPRCARCRARRLLGGKPMTWLAGIEQGCLRCSSSMRRRSVRWQDLEQVGRGRPMPLAGIGPPHVGQLIGSVRPS
jgi:hypothetical protein